MNIKYIFTLLTGVLECLLFAGLLFGWASLVFVLKEEEYFCLQDVTVTEPAYDVTTRSGVTGAPTINVNDSRVENLTEASQLTTSIPAPELLDTSDCSTYQSIQLGRVFTVASMVLAFSTFPNGYILDTFGSWVARTIALILFTIGCILTAVSTAETAWLLYPSMSCIAVGGILMLMTNLQIGNLFGKYRSSVITLMSGSLDSSSFVFLIFKTLHHIGVSLSTLFEVTSVCTALLWVRTFTLLPRKNIPFPLPKGFDYGIGDCKKQKSDDERELASVNGHDGEEKKALHVTTSTDAIPDEPSMTQCVRSSLFWGNALHFSFLQLRNYFYMGTLYDSLHKLDNNQDTISSYLTVFGTCQLFGFLCAPLNGLLVDTAAKYLSKRNSDPDFIPLYSVAYSAIATSILGTVFSIFVAIPILSVQYGSFVLQVIFRSFLYGGSSSFIATAFPVKHFGKIYGLSMCVAGIVLFIQFPLITLALDVLDKNFTALNIMFIVVSVLTLAHPLNVIRWCKTKAAKKSVPTEGSS